MRSTCKKIISIVLIALLLCLSGCNSTKTIDKQVNTIEGELSGKTVILHSNDVHGEIMGYAYMAQVKNDFISKGATVILVDAGDFSQGSIYLNSSKGRNAIDFMNMVGYDVVAIGNHDFHYSKEVLDENLKELNAYTVCTNLTKSNGKKAYNSSVVVSVNDLRIGFIGLLTPETSTKVNPNYVKDLNFLEKEDLYKITQEEIDSLENKTDLIILLSHLGVDKESVGNQSYDVLQNTTGIDFVIDGHSHTVMQKGEKGQAIQSTGTEFENIGVIVIDNQTKQIEDNYLIPTKDYPKDETVEAKAQEIIDQTIIDYGVSIANTQVLLNGKKNDVRSSETNLGDLISDAMLWQVLSLDSLDIEEENVIAINNGGSIRSSIEIGDISRATINAVLPFENTVAVNYIKGSELLEVLEASTFLCPELVGGFPQVSGIKFTINTTNEYDKGEQYPNSIYYGPKSIKRVSIDEINGKPFDENKTYAVVTNNFCAAGGDTYYAFKRAYDESNGFDTGIMLDEAVVNYVQATQDGVIDSKYANPQGRIVIKQNNLQ